MKELVALALVGWFFSATQSLDDYEGANIVSTLGPFASENDCRGYRLSTLAALEAFGIKAAFTQCVERKEA